MDIALGRFEVPALCTRRSDLLDALLLALPPDRIRLGHDFESFEHRKAGVRVNFPECVRRKCLCGTRRRYWCRWYPFARPFSAIGSHEPIFRGYTIWRGLARLMGAIPSGSNSETWGRGKRFGILNTAASGSPGTPLQTPIRAMSILRRRQSELLRMFAGCTNR